MAEELTKTASFQDRLMARIKDSIGELMTDEELKKIMERGVEEALFKPKVQYDNYNREIKREEPFVEKAVKAFLSEKMDKVVREYLAANTQLFMDSIDKAVRDGIGKCMLEALDNRVNSALYRLRADIEDRIQNPGKY